jgi:single-strand DNA-binding protein
LAGSYNRIILVGNLTRDPEIKYVQSGSAVTKFSIAVNRRTKAGDEVMYVDIVAWDSNNYKLAEICNTYLKKGMSVLVEGRLVIRSFEDKDGNKRKATEVVIDNMQMLGNKDDNGGGASRQNRSADREPARSRGGSEHDDRPASDGGGRGRDSQPKGGGSRSSFEGGDGLDEEMLDDEIPFRRQPLPARKWWLE